MNDIFSTWYRTLRLHLARQNTRALVTLVGDVDWCIEYLSAISVLDIDENGAVASSRPQVLVYSNNLKLKSDLAKNNLKSALGTENEIVVYIDQEFDPNVIAALSGTIAGGGILFLCTETKTNSDSAFSIRLNKRIAAYADRLEDIYQIRQNIAELPKIVKSTALETNCSHNEGIENSNVDAISTFGHCKNQQQLDAVTAVEKVFEGRRDRPLVLTADRGRGKSSALAIACAQLIEKSKQSIEIGICAPNIENLDVFFAQLKRILPNGILQDSSFLLVKNKELKCNVSFFPVDQLLREKPILSLLLFDEAAGIPVPLLEKCTAIYHRIVFSSTIHGYEGAGRGFSLKFLPRLSSIRPNFKRLHLTQPIRWADGDPLENLTNDAFLLDAVLPTLDANSIASFKLESSNQESSILEQAAFKVHSVSELSENESLLSQIFSLLVTAHYQTTPSDLKQLLENPKITVVSFELSNTKVGVALLMSEGHKDATAIDSIRNNKRRLRDQFLPQSLLTQCGKKNAFAYQYLRIMRIAIHPEVQGNRLGSAFLESIERYARDEGYDFTGSSFGCNYDLLNFWFKSGYRIARVGFTKDKASGEHSALVLKGICKGPDISAINSNPTKKTDKNNQVFLDEINVQFYGAFSELLTDEFSELDGKLLWLILSKQPLAQLPELNEQQASDVEDFALGIRQYSDCLYGLKPWLLRQFGQPYSADFSVINAKVLQKKSITTICEQHNLTGKKAFTETLLRFVQAQLS